MGVIIDRKLTFRTHAESIKIDCMERLKIIRWCGGVRYGGEQKAVIRIYNALVNSKLKYAFPAWSSISKTTMKKLYTIQTQGIRLASGAFRSSPTDSILVDAGELPLRIQMEIDLICYAMKIKASKTTLCYTITLKRAEELARKRGLEIGEVATKCFSDNLWKFPLPKICFDLKSDGRKHRTELETKMLFNEIKQTKFQDHIAFYTDGSKSKAGTGCSVVSSNWCKRAKLPEAISIFSSEAQAILWAAEKANDDNLKVVIFSDSFSVLQAVQNERPDHPIIKDIASICRQNRNIKLCWVPAHVGIPGNEIADKEAKAAVEIDNIVNIKIPLKDIFKQVKRDIKLQWEVEWQNSDQKLSKIKNCVQRWDSSNRLNRFEEVIITRLRIGHTRLTHGHLMGGFDNSICEICDTPLSVEHILIDCKKYTEKREKHALDSSIESILSDEITKTTKLLDYLKDIDLLYEI